MNGEYFADDRELDLSKFNGIKEKDLKELIEYLEQQEQQRAEKYKNMTREEQIAEYKRTELEDEEYIKSFQKKKQLVIS